MATVTTQVSRQFSDLDMNFNIHPIKKDLNILTGEMAIINSLKNLILLNFYEKPFQPNIGSNVRGLLFENMDTITANALEREIKQIVSNFEPRVNIISVLASPDFDKNLFSISMDFYVINRTEPITISFRLERLR
jgi:phage baseplate assembly protein W